jgi:hypothetical protein
MDNKIQEIRRRRFQYLQKLYDITRGYELIDVDSVELGDQLGFTHDETDRIYDYLIGEYLIRAVASTKISITHHGIVEVEAAITKPDEPTTYFPPINYIHVEQMSGSQIQQGTQQSTQVMNYSENDFKEMLNFIAELKNQLSELKLDPEPQAEIESDIATIETQIKSPRPKSIIVRECLTSLRTILENAAGSVIAALLLSHITTLIK